MAPALLYYTARDNTSQFRRSKEFLKLFNDYDREQARFWLEKNFPPQKHTEVLRDTGGSLFTHLPFSWLRPSFAQTPAPADRLGYSGGYFD